MAKRRKKRIDPAARVALLVGLAFIIAVPAMISVMVKRQERQYEEFVAQQEAERQYLMDLSWIDSDFNLTWLADESLYEQNAEGGWEYTDSETLLRSYDFASGVFSDIHVDSRDTYGTPRLIPSDDSRGYVLWAGREDVTSVYRVDENGKPVRLFRTENKDIADIEGFYGGQLYCHVYENYATLDWDKHLVSWNSETKETHHYRGEAICISPDGRAVILEKRDTGLVKTYETQFDDNGEYVEEPIEKQRTIWGETLGVEDAQGNWSPLLNVGQDGVFYNVACAAWIDEDRLLVFANLPNAIYSYNLYQITLSRNEFSICTTANGEIIQPHDNDIVKGSMTISPDGRYIAYQIWTGSSKSGTTFADIIVQSLETGRCAQICPRDAVIEEEKKSSVEFDYDNGLQVWTQ